MLDNKLTCMMSAQNCAGRDNSFGEEMQQMWVSQEFEDSGWISFITLSPFWTSVDQDFSP